MDVKIEVPGIGPATLTAALSDRHELYITKVYEQSVKGSAFMKVAGHLLSICHRYPHAKQVCLKFLIDDGLTWQQERTIRAHQAQQSLTYYAR